MVRVRASLFALGAIVLAGTAVAATHPARTGAKARASRTATTHGANLSYLDTAVHPGDDFYSFANGAWVKKATIPPDRSSSGAWLELGIQSEDRLKEIVAQLHARKNLTVEERKLRDLYDAFLDEKQIEARGLAPASNELAAIAALQSPEDVVRLLATPGMHLDGPFRMTIRVDDKDPNAYAVKLSQSGLGLPDRDYYLREGDKALELTREAYQKYITQMLLFAGIADAEKRAPAVYALERSLAEASWPAADRRDADKVYNPMTVPELSKLAPEYPWSVHFAAAGVSLTSPKGDRVAIVAEKSAFPPLAKVFASTPVPVWRDYLTVRYLHGVAGYLPKRVDDADFAMYGTMLQGRSLQLDRPTRAVHLLDNRMGEALGKLFVRKYFPPEAKAKARLLVTNLLKTYEEDLKTLPWMTEATWEKALEKLHQFTVKVGYPDHWRDYSALAIRRDDLLGDIKASDVFEWNRDVKRLDKPVDKTEWGMTPPTVNAYYNETANEIVFPAGILQPPRFDPAADDAYNYGGIGCTIGHEISHGFDDQGSKYDGSGALRQWWTEADRKLFDERTGELAHQYDEYEPLPGLHVNGRLTLGENIADLAGVVIARKAYHLSLGGKTPPVIHGYTGDQRFYIAYAQSWRSKSKDEAVRQRVLSNEHSPPEFRVNGVVRNDEGWYAAFPDVKPGDKYYLAPEKRILLW